MAQVNPYLTFNGNCEEAFSFYKDVFGKEFQFIGRFKDMPSQDGKELADNMKEKIMHVSLPISEETILMASDANPEMGRVIEGNNFSLSVGTKSKEEADKIFAGLSTGGKVILPMADTFWGAYFGMLTDRFNIGWMVNYDHTPQG